MDMTEDKKYICSNEKCELEASGMCAEGHEDISECPNCSENNSELLVQSEESESPSSKFIELHSGHDLSLDETFAITSKSMTRLIVLAGSSESGKTTLLASIYEMFQKSPFAGYLFAGSETLLGFEERCHLVRIASNRTEPYTKRTTMGHDDKFLHLKVCKESDSTFLQDILFSDISGERYEHASNSDEDCKQLKIIRRADHFGLVIDGEKISNLDTRQSAFQDAKNIMRRCVENGMIGASSFVSVIFSKYDLYKKCEETTNKFIPQIKDHFVGNYKKKVLKLDFFEVAACPQLGSDVPYGYGLDRLFPKWVDESPFYINTLEDYSPNIANGREFEKFLPKHFKEKLS